MAVTVFSNVIMEVTAITLVVSYLLEVSHELQTFKGRGTHGCESQETGIIGSHFRSCLPQGGKSNKRTTARTAVIFERKQRAERQEACT